MSNDLFTDMCFIIFKSFYDVATCDFSQVFNVPIRNNAGDTNTWCNVYWWIAFKTSSFGIWAVCNEDGLALEKYFLVILVPINNTIKLRLF